ncbi:MAG TPA: DEAD/DEAH box helicase, partial [Myxococcaceae bacterium]|nr:DEAD/DEAH box helicase [Myxococcaceae bacterium]
EYLRLAVDREELRGRWDRQLGVLGAPSSAQLGPVPEEACAQFTGEIRRCLSWAGTVWSPVLSELRSHGLRWQDLLDEQPPNLTPNGALLRLKELVVGPLQRVLRARAVALAKVALDQRIDTEARRLDQWGGAGAASATVRELVRALRQREGAAYASAFARLVELTSRRALLDRRRTLLAKLEPVAHAWASAIRDRRGAHAQEVPPGEPAEAWVWRQLHDELERRGRVNLTELQQNIETKSGELRRITAELIECRAWAGQTRRTTLRQRQALVGWLDTIRKIGKGTGKRAPRLRAEAARKMNECKDAVPVWVMPLAQVVENFDAGMRFDVVIIDEASQSDVMALIALYFARRAVVVGDHEQVSPSAVGEQIEVVGHLIDEHLDGVPNGILYNGTTSVYDLARQSFGGMVCLTEHFRCVPEIIEFSNQLSYDGRIKPLRESGTSKLEPLLTHRVEGHASDKVNTTEAMAVATLLAAALEREEYKDKTFGVISLVGEEQALEIERLLREHLHPAELERRRILCGNAAQFQGDERDVMFLSMVDSPQGGPLTLREQNMFKQRFNVAVSRAKDQLWVVH